MHHFYRRCGSYQRGFMPGEEDDETRQIHIISREQKWLQPQDELEIVGSKTLIQILKFLAKKLLLSESWFDSVYLVIEKTSSTFDITKIKFVLNASGSFDALVMRKVNFMRLSGLFMEMIT